MPINYQGMTKNQAKKRLEEAARKLDNVYFNYKSDRGGAFDAKLVSMANEIRKHLAKL